MQVSSTSLLDYAITREYYNNAPLTTPGVQTTYPYVPTGQPVHQNVIVALKAKLNGQKVVKDFCDGDIEETMDDDDDDADSTHSYPIKCTRPPFLHFFLFL